MDSQSLDSEVADPLFDTALAEYQRQVDEQGNGFRGEIRRQILARFPDYESEFAEFFAVEDEFPGSRGPHPGGSIGPYRLLQKVGEGAMGTVWCARQLSPIRRLVALKLVKSAINSGEVLKRFQIEQDALALMDHSSIAKIFDAGIGPDGQPYFAMELIRGVSIVAYCDSNDLSVNDRLNLILQVCAAVQHAHQKGVIHRDLKPTNIMVTISDGKPAVKVIDFGLAKALHHHLNDDSIQTQFGQVLGSFDYMPPEQAELSALGVDTRSDVYALGAVLYELLTGSKPLQLEKKTVAEKLRLIRDEDAPSPSVSLSASAEKLEQLAAQRRPTAGRRARSALRSPPQ